MEKIKIKHKGEVIEVAKVEKNTYCNKFNDENKCLSTIHIKDEELVLADEDEQQITSEVSEEVKEEPIEEITTTIEGEKDEPTK